MQLKDKVAIITGGTRGIGKAITFELIYQGAKVVFTYLKNDEAAGIILDEIKELKGEAEALKQDVRSLESANVVAQETIKKFGRIDILVNNAGIIKDKALMMMNEEDWEDVIKTNLTGYFNMTRACIVTMMRQKSGNIVNISSISGITGTARQVNYSASKAGIIGFTKSLAKEVAAYNIRVNVIAPGFTETDMISELKNKDELIKAIPLARFGKPEEIAKPASFLLSDKAEYITGQVMKVDGGLAI